jgi:hypothetical protein
VIFNQFALANALKGCNYTWETLPSHSYDTLNRTLYLRIKIDEYGKSTNMKADSQNTEDGYSPSTKKYLNELQKISQLSDLESIY